VNEEDPLIVFLYNVEHKAPYGNPMDLIALQETANTAARLIEALSARGYRVHPIEVEHSLTELRQALKPFSPRQNFIFNYCDSFRGNNMAATKIVHLIETLGFKHTGSSAEVVTACIDKNQMKQRLAAAGIPTPRYQVFTEAGGEFQHRFPAIVKPMTDDGSVGINLDSVVSDQPALLKQVACVLHNYRQPALVEEFIGGRELAVSAWGNEIIEVLPIAEQDYSAIANPLNRLLTYDAKWVEDSAYYHNIPTRVPADLTPEQARLVSETTVRAMRAMGLRDFCRADIRYEDGVPYIIDINEIPDLALGAGFPNSALAAGYAYAEIPEHILRLALKREDWHYQLPLLKSVSPRLQMANVS
jgi:D-alanine-D-alanine ligase